MGNKNSNGKSNKDEKRESQKNAHAKDAYIGKPLQKSRNNFLSGKLDDLEVIESLGKGEVTESIRGTYQDNDIVFRKLLVKLTEEQMNSFQNEVLKLSTLRHPNVVSFYTTIIEPEKNTVGIVTEYCDNGHLENFMTQHKDDFPLKVRFGMLSEICSALKYLHSNGIVNGDVKLRGILLDGQLSSKLSDFGFTKLIVNKELDYQKAKNISYIPPEVCTNTTTQETSKSDIYRFGILAYILLTMNTKPYGDDPEVLKKVGSDPNFRPDLSKLVDIPENILEPLKNILTKCWEQDPANRPDIKELYVEIRKIRDDIDDEIDPAQWKDFILNGEEMEGEGGEGEGENPQIVVYLKRKEDEDEDADDCLLDDFTFDGLKKVICEWAKCDEEKIVKISRQAGNGFRRITKDSTVERIENDDLIVVEFKE